MGVSSVYLFVYGTLRQGHGPMADRLWGEATLRGVGTVQGRKVALGEYFALVQDGEGAVAGEVAQLYDPIRSLEWLDEYEGENYERVLTSASMQDGAELPVWVYRYRGS